MRNQILMGLGTVIGLGAVSTQAGEAGKFYFGANAGVAFVQDLKIKSFTTTGSIFNHGTLQALQTFNANSAVFAALPAAAQALPVNNVLAGITGGTYDAQIASVVGAANVAAYKAQIPTFQAQLAGLTLNQWNTVGFPAVPNFNTLTLTQFTAQIASSASPVQGLNDKAELDTGVAFTLRAGYNVTENFAAELEAGFLWNTADKLMGLKLKDFNSSLDVWHIPVMVNGIYSVKVGEKLHPYLGVGAGAVFTMLNGKFNGQAFDDTDVAFGYQAKAGIAYDLTSKLGLGLEYKFMGTTDHSWKDQVTQLKTDGSMTHSVMATLNYAF